MIYRCKKGICKSDAQVGNEHEMMRMVPRFFQCVPVLVISGFLVILTGCYEPDIAAPSLDELRKEQLPDQESWYTQFDVLDCERPRLQIHADYLAKYVQEDSTYMILEGHPDSLNSRVLAYLFDEVGDSSATIIADQMIYYEIERRIESKGNVIVNTNDNKTLKTEFLIWNELDRRVKTSGFVHITTPRENIQGYNLDADENLVGLWQGQPLNGRYPSRASSRSHRQ